MLSHDANPAILIRTSNKHLNNQTTVDAERDISQDGYLEEGGNAGDTKEHDRKWLNSFADGASGDDGGGGRWWGGTCDWS